MLTIIVSQDTFFPDTESVETTKDLGEKIISLLKKSQDKHGRLIASEFMALPDKVQYPDYFEATALPLSINMIDSKLKRGEYDNMTALESDLKRMVQNAKDYNSSKSEVFEDAERIRKALSNFMTKHNPAYQDPEYRAAPTPIPDHMVKAASRGSPASGSEHGTIKLRLNTGSRPRSAAPSEPVENSSPDGSMKQDQLDLLDELSIQPDAQNFEKKPPKRDYPDYYKVIERPTSINDVRTLVQQGKIRSWEDFAKETRLIWSNAKEYNEPSSDIYAITETLQKWLEEQLQAHGVPPKVVQRLSLKTAPQPPQIKLKLGTPVTPAATNGQYTVDEAALARQNREMASALSRARDTSEPGTTPATAATPNVPSSLRRSVSVVDLDMPSKGANGVTAASVEPAKAVRQPSGAPSIPTPTLESLPPRQELKPSPYTSTVPMMNGYHPAQPVQQPSGIFAESTNPIDRKFRDTEKSAPDAIIQSVACMTNPLLPQDPKWRLVRYASPTKTQTSYYTYLPSTHANLRVLPDLHADLKAGKRKYKLFVLNNGAVLPASPDVAGQGVYDLHLQPGENVVTIEAISALKEGDKKGYARDWEQFDFERVTFYIFLRPKA